MRQWAIPRFYLMVGRIPRLPIDVLFHIVLHDPSEMTYDKYMVSLTNDLKEALAIAQDLAVKEQSRHALIYNRKVKGSHFEVGDRVLLSNRKERSKKKLADKCESTIFSVMEMVQMVHRNLLMLGNFLPLEDACSGSGLLTFVSWRIVSSRL